MKREGTFAVFQRLRREYILNRQIGRFYEHIRVRNNYRQNSLLCKPFFSHNINFKEFIRCLIIISFSFSFFSNNTLSSIE